jgi:hypothetical protein
MSNYPSDLDNDTTLPSVIDGSTDISGEAINALKAAVIAIQRAVGSDPQGTLATLVARLAVAINDDGTLKSSALIAAGLIALPITNSQVSVSAGIQESKLALDFATQFLRDRITSNDIDITVLQTDLAELIANFSSHHLGTALKHDAEQILLDTNFPLTTPPWLVGVTATNVKEAISGLADLIADHTSPSKVAAHAASSISVDAVFQYITADNVQEALEQLEAQRSSELDVHRDESHSNGISMWENDPIGWNRNLPLYPDNGLLAGSTVVSRYVVDFNISGPVLLKADFRVRRGDVLVSGGIAYSIADVGPRVGVGSKPTLTESQVELLRPLPVSSGTLQVTIFGRSSVSNLKVALASAIFAGSSTADSIILARPNAAKVVSLGFNPLFLDSGSELTVEVGVTSSASRSVTITGLHLNRDGSGPVTSITASSVTERINYALCSAAAGNRIPAAAYVIGSEIALAHNWSDSADYWIRVTSATSASVQGSILCGFGDLGSETLDVKSYPTITGKYWVGGKELTDFGNYYDGVGSISGSTIGITGSPAAAGILPGHVVHLLSAGTNSEIGSYQITAVGPSTIQVNATLTATASALIRVDASAVSLANLDGASDALLVELFVDGEGFTEASLRASCQEGIAGLKLIDASDSRAAGADSVVSTAVSATEASVKFIAASAPNAKTVRTSISSKIKLFDATGVSWAEFASNGAIGLGTTSVEFFDHADEEGMLELALIRFSNRKVESISDKRLFGSLGLDELREDVVQTHVESPIAELRSNGVVHGFSIVEDNVAAISAVYPAGTKMVKLDGGIAYVEGVRVAQVPYYIAIPPVDGVYFLCISVSGTINVIRELDFSLAEILEGFAGPVAPLVKTTRALAVLTSVSVAYNIANIDERIDAVLDLTNNFIGNFSSMAAAIAYLNSYPFEERSRLRIVSRRAASVADDILVRDLATAITIDIDGYVRNIVVESDAVISSDSLLSREEPHAQSLVIRTDRFIAKGLILKDVTIELAAISGGEYLFDGCEFADDAVITVDGSSGLGKLTFSDCKSRGGAFSISCATSDGDVMLSDCSFSGGPASSGVAHTGSISVEASSATLNDVHLSGVGFEWTGSSSEFSLFVNNLTISDVLVASSAYGFSCQGSPAMVSGLAMKNVYREAGTIINLGTAITSRASDVLVDVCEIQFTVGVPSVFCAGGESFLDGIVISNLTMPLPTSTDVHVRVPHLIGLLYDGSEIISVDAEDIIGSVGIGTSSGAGADGITAASADNTLLASSSGTDIDIIPIAVGSGYVLGGSTVFGPIAPASLALLGDPAFVDRGLLQVYANGIAEVLAAYIVQKVPNSVEPLDLGFAEIVDISEGHVTTASGFDLNFDGTLLSWANGEPVTATLGVTYRLFCSDYSGWIDVKVATAPGAAGSDTYKVFASKKNNGGLLLGHCFWDGSSSLSAVEDKRYFGNISGSELTDATNASIVSPVDDLRPSMVYAGGEVIAGISVGLGLTVVRITGPVIAYVAGRRFEVPLAFGGESVIIGKGGYAGITLLGTSSDNYLYVDAAGVFQVGSGWPTDDHARIAEVTVATGAVSAIVDSRRATVGLTSVDSLEWETGTKTLSILSSGSTAGTTLLAETLEATTLNASEVTRSTGDLTVGAAIGSTILRGNEAAADAVWIDASNAAGGIKITSGTGGFDLSSSGGITLTGPIGAASMMSIANGATASGFTKMVNIGGAGAGGSQTEINIGQAVLGPLTVNVGAGLSGASRTINIGTGSNAGNNLTTVVNIATANVLGSNAVNIGADGSDILTVQGKVNLGTVDGSLSPVGLIRYGTDNVDTVTKDGFATRISQANVTVPRLVKGNRSTIAITSAVFGALGETAIASIASFPVDKAASIVGTAFIQMMFFVGPNENNVASYYVSFTYAQDLAGTSVVNRCDIENSSKSLVSLPADTFELKYADFGSTRLVTLYVNWDSSWPLNHQASIVASFDFVSMQGEP